MELESKMIKQSDNLITILSRKSKLPKGIHCENKLMEH